MFRERMTPQVRECCDFMVVLMSSAARAGACSVAHEGRRMTPDEYTTALERLHQEAMERAKTLPTGGDPVRTARQQWLKKWTRPMPPSGGEAA